MNMFSLSGQRVARKSHQRRLLLLSDHFLVITHSARLCQEQIRFLPLGRRATFVNNDSNHYKFTGKERDAETQLGDFQRAVLLEWAGALRVSADWSPTPNCGTICQF